MSRQGFPDTEPCGTADNPDTQCMGGSTALWIAGVLLLAPATSQRLAYPRALAFLCPALRLPGAKGASGKAASRWPVRAISPQAKTRNQTRPTSLSVRIKVVVSFICIPPLLDCYSRQPGLAFLAWLPRVPTALGSDRGEGQDHKESPGPAAKTLFIVRPVTRIFSPATTTTRAVGVFPVFVKGIDKPR